MDSINEHKEKSLGINSSKNAKVWANAEHGRKFDDDPDCDTYQSIKSNSDEKYLNKAQRTATSNFAFFSKEGRVKTKVRQMV